jgi:hypothetical protein
MPFVARAAYTPLRALAVNVIAFYSRSRRKLRKPDRMTSIELVVKPHYSVSELTALRIALSSFFSAGIRAKPAPAGGCLAAQAFQEREVVATSRSERSLTRGIGVRGKQCEYSFSI